MFIEPFTEEAVTKVGIVLPDTAEKEKPMQGKVIAVGPGKLNEKGERIPMSVKVGDRVLFKKYGPDEIEFDKKDIWSEMRTTFWRFWIEGKTHGKTKFIQRKRPRGDEKGYRPSLPKRYA